MKLARLLLAAALALLLPHPLSASDIESSNWSETAGSNNATPPHGFPEGMAPSAVNDAARETMRAVKSDWNRNHATASSTGSANAYAVTYAVAPPALAQGQRFCFKASFSNTGAATLNVNAIGAKAIRRSDGTSALASGDILQNQHVCVSYDATQDVFQVVTPLPAAAFTGGTLTGTTTMSGAAFNTASYADVASASTTDIGGAASNNVRITGTVTITSFGSGAAGIHRNVRFAGALTLTHNATSLILPTAGNITTAANDTLEAVSLGSGNWIVTDYQRASGEAAAGTPIREVSIQVFTSSGTYTAPSDLLYAIVEVQAPGGGSGGADAATTAGACTAGAGAGGYSRELLTAASIGASQSVTIGAPGTAGSNAGGSGGDGGTTSFGALLSATGGTGSVGSGSNTDQPGAEGGDGGNGSGGTLNIAGGSGSPCITIGTSKMFGGSGGTAHLGGGARGHVQTNTNDDSGTTGGDYGGGAGGANDDDTTGSAGAAGGPGVVIVWEFRS